MRWFQRLWARAMRRYDLLILWPAMRRECLKNGVPLDVARASFCFHCMRDENWLRHLHPSDIFDLIDHLE